MTVGSTLMKYGIKAAGLAAAGALLYDAHKDGRRVAQQYSIKKGNEALEYWYEKSRTVNSTSTLISNMKNKIVKMELDNNFRGFVNGIIGYAKGFAGMAISDVVPWALSISAIMTKGKWAKASGIGLAAYGAFAFMKNVLSIGTQRNNYDI